MGGTNYEVSESGQREGEGRPGRFYRFGNILRQNAFPLVLAF